MLADVAAASDNGMTVSPICATFGQGWGSARDHATTIPVPEGPRRDDRKGKHCTLKLARLYYVRKAENGKLRNMQGGPAQRERLAKREASLVGTDVFQRTLLRG